MLCMRRSATPSALCQAISGHGSEGLPDVHAAAPPTRTHTTASDPRVRKAVECNLRCTFNKSAELYLVNQTSHVSSYTAQQPWQNGRSPLFLLTIVAGFLGAHWKSNHAPYGPAPTQLDQPELDGTLRAWPGHQ
jgi:hypothetical protein|eukprot:COSAG03_NODE_316_length_9052_cov_3.462080_6_plen_134_part_00